MTINAITLLPQFKNLSSNRTIIITKSHHDNKFKLTLGEIRENLKELCKFSSLGDVPISKDNSGDTALKVKNISIEFTILQTKVSKKRPDKV